MSLPFLPHREGWSTGNLATDGRFITIVILMCNPLWMELPVQNVWEHSPALQPNPPPIQLVLGKGGGVSPVVTRRGRHDDHSPPTSAAVKEARFYTFTPP
jgi:hypothetical protein